MDADRWQKVKRYFQIAVERENTAGRLLCVAELCAGDEELRREVERLLSSDAKAQNFIEKSFGELTDEIGISHQARHIGQRIGAFRIVRQIATGGMGSVFLAERDDDDFKHRVAIKVIKPSLNYESVQSRFIQERQILASLDHPNIARLIDGGTTDNHTPYLVMEYVEGLQIDEYCDRENLMLDERLELFNAVCAAVHHAHQHLVIHRDLKPSNILVTAEGMPKLLDFGVAKLLAPVGDVPPSATLAFGLMTPEYASPEQLLGEKVSTASDIYSLGVILYKLLSGHHPFDPFAKDTDSLRRFAGERLYNEIEFSAPSTVGRKLAAHDAPSSGKAEKAPIPFSPSQLRGDLDNIILKAMHREPARRYSSVQQFSEDINRYKNGLPVVARADTFRYRFGKFVKRNRLFVSALSLFLMISAGFSALTAWQAHVADRQRALAEKRFQEQREVLKSFIFKYHDAVENLPGATGVREMLVKDASEYFTRLARDAEDDQQLKRELAQAFLKVGDVQGSAFSANLGDTKGAMENYRKGIALLEEVAVNYREDLGFKTEIANAYQKLGRLLLRAGKLNDAFELQSKSSIISEEINTAQSADEHLRRLTRSRLYLGDVKLKSYHFDEACDIYRRAIETSENLTASEAENLENVRVKSAARQRLALCLERQVMYKTELPAKTATEFLLESEKQLEIALVMIQPFVEKDPLNPVLQRIIALSHLLAASVTSRLGNFDRALERLAQAKRILAVIANDRANWEVRYDLAIVLDFTGDIENRRGKTEASLKSYAATLAELEQLSSADALNGDVREAIYNLHIKTGDIFFENKNFARALQFYAKVRQMRDENWTKEITSEIFAGNFETIKRKEQICLDKLLINESK